MIKNYRKLNYKMSAYYPPYRSSSNNIKVELDLANYAQKLIQKILLMLMLVVLRVRLI